MRIKGRVIGYKSVSILYPRSSIFVPLSSILDPLCADRCKAGVRASLRRILQIAAIVARLTKLLLGMDGLRPSTRRRRPRRRPSPADEPDFVYPWRGSDR